MKTRIKNLDTFRVLASVIVIIGHIELFRMQNFGCKNFYFVPSGHIAVMMFFVISGFLISFLLTKEKEQYGIVSLKDFYLRRILRIWPLYYLVLFISAFFASNSLKSVLYAVLILPNISHTINCGWETSPQIWSIGVENLFYIIFPMLILFYSSKKIPILLSLFIVGYAILPHCIAFINVRTLQNMTLETINNKFFYCNKFDSIAIGCLLGHLYATKSFVMNLLYNKVLFYMCLIIAIICWGGNIELKHFNDEFMSILFAVVILNICTNNDLHINIENIITQFLGKISYGMYMYHWIVLLIAFKIFPLNESFASMILLYCFVFGITIFCAWISYETYEKYFLNLKRQFER